MAPIMHRLRKNSTAIRTISGRYRERPDGDGPVRAERLPPECGAGRLPGKGQGIRHDDASSHTCRLARDFYCSPCGKDTLKTASTEVGGLIHRRPASRSHAMFDKFDQSAVNFPFFLFKLHIHNSLHGICSGKHQTTD
jgi:hypothetical protein